MEPVYFLRLKVHKYRCFKDIQLLDLSDGNGNWKKWTIILGDNGTGKSTLLSLLAGFEMVETRGEPRHLYMPQGVYFGEPFPDTSNEEDWGGCSVGLNIYWEPESY